MNPKNRTREYFKLVAELSEDLGSPAPAADAPGGLFSRAPHACPSSDKFKCKMFEISALCEKLKQELKDLKKYSEESTLFHENLGKTSKLSFLVKRDVDTATREIEAAAGMAAPASSQATRLNLNALAKARADLASSAKLFQDLLSQRKNKLRQHSKRRQLYSGQTSIRPRDLSSLRRSDPLLLEEEGSRSNAGGAAQQMATQRAEAERDVFLSERLEATQGVEQTISDLGSMYTRLAAIVAVQDEACTRIDANVEETAGHVGAGHVQLEKFYAGVSGNRLQAAKVFTMLVFVAALFFLLFS